MPGKKLRSIKRPEVYEALRDEGLSKARAAAIANKGATAQGRQEMAAKAAATKALADAKPAKSAKSTKRAKGKAKR